MRIKQEPGDFRVRELLADGVLVQHGEFRVYRVTKRKLTSLQAAEALASLAGANAGDVAMCGLKDRQGITTQHMALRHGKGVSVREDDLRIETVGFCRNELTSEASTGNAFELVLRGLTHADVTTLSRNMVTVRRCGLINYFDEQRFGNLKHNQGWIALDLLRGEHETALKVLLTSTSNQEHPRSASLKRKLSNAWGNWADCRDIAGRFGQYHSVFEYLKKNHNDFAGAFFHVASRLRLIHLYAYQSHLWNRAVSEFVRENTNREQRVVIDSREGPLGYPSGDARLPVGPDATFRLPGPRLDDVKDERQRALLTEALAADGIAPANFVIEGVPGFALKGEDRPLFVEPRHLRVRPPESDTLNRPMSAVHVRFELPRGAYATLVVRRLLAERPFSGETAEPRAREETRPPSRDEHRAPRADRGPRAPRFERDRERAPRDDRRRAPHAAPRRDRGPRRPPRSRSSES